MQQIERDEFLNGLINSLAAPVFVKDRAHRWLYVNDALCAMIGISRETLIGKSDYDFFPREQADVFWKKDEEVFTSGITNENEEQLTDKQGVVHSIITRKSLFSLSSGHPILVGFIIDVTEQRKVEKLLDKEKEWLKLAVDGADLGLWDWNLAEGRVSINSQWLSMLDYDASDYTELTYQQCVELLHQDDRERVQGAIEKFFRGETPTYSFEMRLRRKGGGYCWVRTRGRVVERNPEGAPIRLSGTHLDIDDVKRQEDHLHATIAELKLARASLEAQTRELARAREIAECASRSKSEFLANMSHEIRTPMTGVLGMAQLLQETSLNEDQQSMVENIIFSGRILLTVINDILDFSKIEAQKIDFFERPFDLPALFSGLEGVLGRSATNTGVSLSISVDPSVPRRVIGDSARLQQILTNILANSIKFTPTGGYVLLNACAAKSANGLYQVTFEVFDSGIGIEAAAQARILRAFEQATGDTSAKFGGTGLGLAISNRLIQLMGGELSVRSVVGSGSTFCFTIPFKEAAPEAELKREPSEAEKSIEIRPLKILVAEDNLVNQKLVSRILAKEGHQVVIAASGKEVLEMVKPGAFDLVLMDIEMPVMTGDEATRELRSNPEFAKLPIVALTAHALKYQTESFLAAGMDGCVTKPIDKRQLFEEISRVIGEQS